jgi:WD40 repeat protein
VETGRLVRQTQSESRGFFRPDWLHFSPDRKFLILTAHEGETRVIDVTTGKLVLSPELEAGVFGAAISPDARLVVLSGKDGVVRIRDIRTGRVIRELAGHPQGVSSGSFSPDGKMLLTSGINRVRLWDVASGKIKREATVEGEPQVFFVDGKTVVQASEDTIRVLDALTGKEIRQLRSRRGRIREVALSSDGKRLVVHSEEYGHTVWDVATGEQLHNFDGHWGSVESLAFSPDGKQLVSVAGQFEPLHVWDVSTSKLLLRIPCRDWPVCCVAFAPDGKTIACGSYAAPNADNPIRLLDSTTGRRVRALKGHLGSLHSLAYSPDGRHLVSSGRDERVRLWEVESGKQVGQLGSDHILPFMSFGPDGKSFLAADWYGGLTLYATDGATRLRTFGEFDNTRRQVVHATFLPTRKTVVSVEVKRLPTAEHLGEVRFWDADRGQLIRSFQLPMDRRYITLPIAFSPDRKMLAVGERNRWGNSAVELWDVEAGQLLGRLFGHNGESTALAFSSDGRFLASGGDDTSILLWDLRQARLLSLWRHLGGKAADAALASKALAANPEGVVAFLQERLRLARDRESPHARSIADLDSEQFKMRNRASEQLEQSGAAAEFALRLALEAQPPAEVKRRAAP